MTHVTCRLTAKNRNQLRDPTLGNRVWATFNFSLSFAAGVSRHAVHCLAGRSVDRDRFTWPSSPRSSVCNPSARTASAALVITKSPQRDSPGVPLPWAGSPPGFRPASSILCAWPAWLLERWTGDSQSRGDSRPFRLRKSFTHVRKSF